LVNGSNIRLDGMTLAPFQKGRNATWNVTIVHPNALSYLRYDASGKGKIDIKKIISEKISDGEIKGAIRFLTNDETRTEI